MPMGLTPGFLSKGINLLALYGSSSSGFSSSVARIRVAVAPAQKIPRLLIIIMIIKTSRQSRRALTQSELQN